jgi:hypothetical protein
MASPSQSVIVDPIFYPTYNLEAGLDHSIDPVDADFASGAKSAGGIEMPPGWDFGNLLIPHLWPVDLPAPCEPQLPLNLRLKLR